MFISPTLYTGGFKSERKGRIEFSDPGNGYLPSASEFLNIHKGIYFSPSYGLFAFALRSSKGLLLLSFQCFSS